MAVIRRNTNVSSTVQIQGVTSVTKLMHHIL